MARYFRLPFAVNGDKKDVPDTSLYTELSYNTGYTQDYQRNPETDPLARRIERNYFNDILYQVTDTLKTHYETGTPPFITAAENDGKAYSYDRGSRVLLNNRIYECTTNNITTTPPATGWVLVDIAGYDERYIEPGEFGLGGNAIELDDLNVPLSYDKTEFNFYFGNKTSNKPNDESGTCINIHRHSGTSIIQKTQFAITQSGQAFTRSLSNNVWNVWRQLLTNTGSLSELLDKPSSVKNLGLRSNGENDSRYLLENNNLSDLVSKSTSRNNLQLGTAAVLDQGEDYGDLMEVGAFGLGSFPYNTSGDLNKLSRTEFIYSDSGSINRPIGSGNGAMINIKLSGPYCFQTYHEINSDNFYVRTQYNDWKEWILITKKPRYTSLISWSSGISVPSTAIGVFITYNPAEDYDTKVNQRLPNGSIRLIIRFRTGSGGVYVGQYCMIDKSQSGISTLTTEGVLYNRQLCWIYEK